MSFDGLAPVTVVLRWEGPGDEPFLRRLITETIARELGAGSWPEPMRGHLLGIQHDGRRHSGKGQIVQFGGCDVGWLVTSVGEPEIRIVEIMVALEWRRRGIGTAVIRQVLAEAALAVQPVRLMVNAANSGAIRLYERLGFRRIAGDFVQLTMEKAAR